MRLSSHFLTLAILTGLVTACHGATSGVEPPVAAQLGVRSAPEAVSYHLIHAFTGGKTGSIPLAAVLDRNGVLFGTTALGGNDKGNCVNYFCGTAYTVKTSGAGFATIYQFLSGTDGATPYTKLEADSQGALYGSSAGGPYPPNGMVYALHGTAGGKWQHDVIHSLAGGTDGDTPSALTIDQQSGNAFATSAGLSGNDCCGTIFEVNVAGSGYKIWHHFIGGKDGSHPEGPLVEDAATGTYYGATSEGGNTTTICSTGCGTIFKLAPAGGGKYRFQTLYRFEGSADGAYPYGALALVPGKAGPTILGAAVQGGIMQCSEQGTTIGCGVVFSIDPAAHATTLYAFKGGSVKDGQNPSNGVTLAGRTLYGTTTTGGSAGYGTIFRLAATGGQFAILHSFQRGNDGALPIGELSAVNGTLFGVTEQGGGSKNCTAGGSPVGCGTIFSIAQ